MWQSITNLFGGIFGIGEKYVEGKNKIRLAKVDARVAKWSAVAASYEADANRTHSWEMEALKQSQYSWKDEFWTIVLGILLLAPMILAIIGVATGDQMYQEMIKAAWSSYTAMPLVIQALYPFVILASIGIRYKGKREAAESIKEAIGSSATGRDI